MKMLNCSVKSVQKMEFLNLAVNHGQRIFSTANLSQSVQNEENFQNAKSFKSIPGPHLLKFLIRMMPGGQYHKIEAIEMYRKLTAEYGKIFKLAGVIGNYGVVVLTDPVDIETVFRNEGVWPYRVPISTFEHYRHHVRPDIFKNMGGLSVEQGELWGKTRSMVGPIMLKPAAVNAYIPVADEIATEFCEHLKTIRDDKNEVPANFLAEINKWSLESISSIALNQRIHLLGASKNNDANAKAMQLIQAISNVFVLSYDLEMMPPIWRYVETPKFKKLMKSFDTITDTAIFYIDQAVEKLKQNPAGSEQKREPSVFEKLLKIDKHIALVVALDMILAGVDTTSSTVSNVLYHLSKNPEKQEKLREEVQNLPMDENGYLMPSSLLKIPYLRASIKEAMRLSPIIGGNVRAAGRDLVIKGYKIPKGTDIAMLNMLSHYEEEHYKHPNKFMPERWLKEGMPSACPEAKASNPFVYLPFGFGVRSCVGKRFAEMETYVIITRLLKQYRIEFNYGPLKYRTSFVQTPTSDLKFKITEI